METTPPDSHERQPVNDAPLQERVEVRAGRSPRESWRRHPVHIVCVGTDHVALHIDHVVSDVDVAAIVERIDDLLDAGWERIDITPASAARRYTPMMPGVRDHVSVSDRSRPRTRVA